MQTTFQAIYRAEFPYVWNTLRRLGVRHADLGDLSHEVFVVAFRRLSDFDQARPVRPWLFGIAFRVVAHFRRAQQTNPESCSDVSPDELAAPAQGPEEALAARQDRALVARALDTLDLDRRAVFVMHELEGQAVPEIARTLDVPLNTAYSRLRLARRDFVEAVRRTRRGGEDS